MEDGEESAKGKYKLMMGIRNSFGAEFSEMAKLRITCLIGNGFDIGLGLKTSYKDFLHSFLSNNKNLSDSKRWLIKEIKKDIDNWSDAELAFGKLNFSEQGQNVEDKFLNCMRDIYRELKVYLLEQERRLVIPDEDRRDVATSFLNYLIQVLRFDVDGVKSSEFQRLFITHNEIELNFINFNYTRTLETILDLDDDCSPRHIFFKDSKLKIEINHVLHPHGALDRDIVFGVADSSQIVDGELAKLSEIDGYLIKGKMLNRNKKEYDEANNLIGSSDIIFSFGLSYGVTDKNWWDQLAIYFFAKESLKGLGKGRMMNLFVMSPFTLGGHNIETPADKIYNFKHERERFLNGMSNLCRSTIKDDNLLMLGYGPYDNDINHKRYYCDPLRLKSIGSRFVDRYVEIDDLIDVKSENPTVQHAVDAHNAIAIKRNIGVFI